MNDNDIIDIVNRLALLKPGLVFIGEMIDAGYQFIDRENMIHTKTKRKITIEQACVFWVKTGGLTPPPIFTDSFP